MPLNIECVCGKKFNCIEGKKTYCDCGMTYGTLSSTLSECLSEYIYLRHTLKMTDRQITAFHKKNRKQHKNSI
jgi:threonine dehydrogenase-like Zn-dependent dehydrogenase